VRVLGRAVEAAAVRAASRFLPQPAAGPESAGATAVARNSVRAALVETAEQTRAPLLRPTPALAVEAAAEAVASAALAARVVVVTLLLSGWAKMGLQSVRNGKSYGAPPASITAPVSGTSLLSVWNLQAGGTGSTAPYSNGTLMPLGGTPVADSTTNMPAYLQTKFAKWDNYLNVWFNIGAATVEVSNYNFSDYLRRINIGGTGTITFTNCKFSVGQRIPFFDGPGQGLNFPTDLNQNVNTTPGSTLVVNFVNCTFNGTVIYGGTGTVNYNYCKFTNFETTLGDPFCNSNWNWCYIAGVGCGPPADAHVEASQMRGPSPATYSINNCMIDIAANGQAKLPAVNPVAGWTAILVGYDTGTVTIANTIIIGAQAVNDNALNPLVVPYVVVLNNPSAAHSLTNCVLEKGFDTYYGTGFSGATLSGNRSYTNVAITAANFV
jgi:hypothetical protein